MDEWLGREDRGSQQLRAVVRSRKTSVSKARRAQGLVLAAHGLYHRQITLLFRGFSAGARGRSLGISTFLRPPSTGVSRRAMDSLIGRGLLDRTQPMRPLGATKPRGWTQRIYSARDADALGLRWDIATGRALAHVRKRRTARICWRFWSRGFKAYQDQRL
jgi:hypothetical protein